MPELTTVSETLYVPLLGRIYASTHCPDILYDQKALDIMKQLPRRHVKCPGKRNIRCLPALYARKTLIIMFRRFYPDTQME